MQPRRAVQVPAAEGLRGAADVHGGLQGDGAGPGDALLPAHLPAGQDPLRRQPRRRVSVLTHSEAEMPLGKDFSGL